jgi:hypothetical protein
MDWLKNHFDRVILAVAGLLVLVLSGLIISWTLSFNDMFAIRNSTKKPNNQIPALETPLVQQRTSDLGSPSQWGPHDGSLFVSEPYISEDGGAPVAPMRKGQKPLFGQVPNEWIAKYNLDFSDPNLLNSDPDHDGFTVLEEYNGHTDPTNPNSKPPYITKLRLEQFIQVPFRLKFTGTPDQGQTFTINTLDLRQPTQFLKIGEMVKGTPYKIIKFEPKTLNRNGLEVDVSELTIENQQTGQKIILVNDQTVNDPTVYAQFKYLWDGSEFKVKKNDSFSVKPVEGTKYKLIDISDSEAVIESPQGDKIHVPKAGS